MTDASAPAVSVILPAYDVERWVGRAVRSALAQEVPGGLEVVAVDDRSTDGTAAALDALAAEDPRLRVLRNPVNSGAGVSRNAACAAARGRWLAVLDADDAYPPGRLARLIARAEAEGLDAIADLPRFHDLAAGKDFRRQLPADGGLRRLDLETLLTVWRTERGPFDWGVLKPVFRRDLFERGIWTYPSHARHGEDFLAYLEALMAGASFGVLHELGYVFSSRVGETDGRFSPGSVTPVNYRRVIADTDALIARFRETPPPADVAASPERIMALLEARRARVLETNARYGWLTLRTGEWRRHWRWLRQHPGNAPLLARMAAAKAAARLGLGRPA